MGERRYDIDWLRVIGMLPALCATATLYLVLTRS
jgi:hypothetical protein